MVDAEPEAVLQVQCGASELQEYGEIVRVADVVRRHAQRHEGVRARWQLDDVEWEFDRYAQFSGRGGAVLSGRVIAIGAVFVALRQQPDGSWAPRPGSEHLEPVDSTAATRQVEHEFELGRSFPDGRGGFWAARTPIHRDGDEHFMGWRFTLGQARIEPFPPT